MAFSNSFFNVLFAATPPETKIDFALNSPTARKVFLLKHQRQLAENLPRHFLFYIFIITQIIQYRGF